MCREEAEDWGWLEKAWNWVCIIAALLIISGCAGTCPTGISATGSGHIENNFYVNSPQDPATGLTRNRAAGDSSGQSAVPSVSNNSSVSSDRGGVTINFKQGTTERVSPWGINATVPISPMGL